MKKLMKNYFKNDGYRYRTYLFLNRPRHCLGICYQLFIMILVIFCIIITPMQFDFKIFDHFLFWIDLSMTVLFSFEFLIQIWASTCLPRYRGPNGFIRIILDPICILDLFIIASTVIGLITNHDEISLISVVLRGFRILQFFEHKYRWWKLIGAVLWNGRFQLLLCVYFALIMIVSISFLLYLIENNSNEGFKTLGRSIWFTLITLTTVGYGDAVPCTTVGKIITAMALVLGASIFSLPAGIIGAGLALKVEKEETLRSNLQENHAASVIQCAWRIYLSRRTFIKNRKRSGSNSSYSLVLIHSRNTPKLKFSNILIIQFIHLLRFFLSCRRFKRSSYLLSMNNFHELYSRNCMEQMEKMTSLETIVRDNEIILNEILTLIKQQTMMFDQKNYQQMLTNVSSKENNERNQVEKCKNCEWRLKYRKMSFDNDANFSNNDV